MVKVVEDEALTAMDHTLRIMTPIASWAWDVAGGAFRTIKTPISVIVGIYLLLAIGTLCTNLLRTSIYQSLSPICRIPGAKMLDLPFCPGKAHWNNATGPPPAEFSELMKVQAKFEGLLQNSAERVSLPLEMKKSETSIRDLRQLVKFSRIPSR